MSNLRTFTIPCPDCTAPLTATIEPRDGGLDKLEGCEHVDALLDDDDFLAFFEAERDAAIEAWLDEEAERRDEGGEG